MRSTADASTDRSRHTERYTVPEAARVLGISPEAVRNRLSRGTLHSIKENARVFVLLDDDRPQHTDGTPGDTPEDTDTLVSAKDETIRVLTEQLEAERAANRENRRLLAALIERTPALESPLDTPSSHEPVDEGAGNGDAPPQPHEAVQRRSRWREFFRW